MTPIVYVFAVTGFAAVALLVQVVNALRVRVRANHRSERRGGGHEQ
jgi:hypothetical protein